MEGCGSNTAHGGKGRAGPGLPQAGLEVIFVLSILKLLALCRNAATLLIQNKQGHGSIVVP